jgi:prefoldin subunit 5
MDDWTTEELEAEEARLSADIQDIDHEITALRERMRALSQKVEPFRVELERRRKARADSDPRTQGIG